jgi:hypothetical protein
MNTPEFAGVVSCLFTLLRYNETVSSRQGSIMAPGQKTFGHTQQGRFSGPAFFKSITVNAAVLAPAMLSGIYLIENLAPSGHAYFIACAILILAVINFVTIALIEPYRRNLGKLTIPAFICAIGLVLLFVMTDALNRFFDHLGYNWLTPLVAIVTLLIYIAVLREKNIALKCHLSINSIALSILWAMGAIDKITLPF